MATGRFEEIDHTADWALRVRGSDFAALLRNAAEGMLGMMGAVAGPGRRQSRRVTLRADDKESLLVAWLEELLFGIEIRGVTGTQFQVEEATDTALSAEISEAPLASLTRHIKAVTFHGLKLRPSAEGLEATVVFDV
jgi:SHS2 domain-containing protein